jgi:uncharacterized membrane protein
MKKYLFLILFSIIFLSPFFVSQLKAEEGSSQIFKARVSRILEEKTLIRPNGEKIVQQNLELFILEGEERGKLVQFFGIDKIDVVANNYYKEGDKVFVMKAINSDESYNYYIVGYVRSNALWYLLISFLIILFLIGGKKGLRAIISLVISLLIILKILVPLVLQGINPLLISLPVSFLILFILIYFTEGWNRRSHLAVISIAISLIITALLAYLFSHLARLTGASNDEVIYLIEASKFAINFKGLLLSAIIIGALGVIDDMAVGQISSVEQIKSANPKLSIKKVYELGLKVGRSHLSAITNTLFLAYVSTALPLILIFSLGQEPFLTFSQIINNEEVATEIVRTLVGVIGVFLVMPISTYLAAVFIKTKE